MKTSSLAFHYAHYLQKHAAEQMLLSTQTKPVTWSDRLHLAWFFVHFCQALRNGVVTFSFWKKDGSIREAKGTTHPVLIPLDKRPKGEKAVSSQYSAISFFDLDKQDWRSFSITNFIGFVTRYEIAELAVNIPPKCTMKNVALLSDAGDEAKPV